MQFLTHLGVHKCDLTALTQGRESADEAAPAHRDGVSRAYLQNHNQNISTSHSVFHDRTKKNTEVVMQVNTITLSNIPQTPKLRCCCRFLEVLPSACSLLSQRLCRLCSASSPSSPGFSSCLEDETHPTAVLLAG